MNVAIVVIIITLMMSLLDNDCAQGEILSRIEATQACENAHHHTNLEEPE